MRRWLSFAMISMATLHSCNRAPDQARAIEDAAEAIGGAEAILAAATLLMEGTGTAYRLGQNQSPDADLPTYEVHSYRKEVDLANNRWRMEQVRTGHFLTGSPVDRQALIQAADRDVAFDVQPDGSAARLAAQVGKDRYAELFHHPLPILKAALQGPSAATLSALREEGRNRVVDVTPVGGIPLTLHLDAATGLPVRVESLSYHPNYGDVVIATSFGEWEQSGDLLLPRTISQTLGPYRNGDFSGTSTVNASIQDLAAPADVASAAAPVPAPLTITSEELAPGVWYLGPGYNSVLIEFPSYAVIVEAAQNDQRALAVIEKAREIVPDKPLRYVINTHFHIDHSGGIRAAVAEGLTVLTHEIHEPYFEEMVARPHTVIADHLATSPAPLQIETVSGDGPYELTDGDRTIVIHRLKEDVHADGMLIVYLPRERILIEADAFTPGARASPFAANLLRQVRSLGLRVDRIAPIHGRVVPFAELETIVRSLEAPTG